MRGATEFLEGLLIDEIKGDDPYSRSDLCDRLNEIIEKHNSICEFLTGIVEGIEGEKK